MLDRNDFEVTGTLASHCAAFRTEKDLARPDYRRTLAKLHHTGTRRFRSLSGNPRTVENPQFSPLLPLYHIG